LPISGKYRKISEFFILLILFFGALVTRVPLLETHPPGLWYDEAINGLDGLSILGNIKEVPEIIKTGGFPLFFTTEQHPREPLYMYFVCLMFLFVKPTVFSLRAVSGVLGAITVPIVYLLVRTGSKNRKFGLASALALLTMRWHIHQSRLALRTILVPLWLSLFFWSFFLAMEKRKKSLWIISGAIFGLGFYTHLSFRFAPFILVCLVLFCFKKRSISWREDGISLILFCLCAFLVFLPLGIDYLMNPFHFWGRMQEVSLFANGFEKGITQIFKNSIRAMGMFSIRGDMNPFLNLAGAPVFTIGASFFFYLGFIICLRRIKTRKEGEFYFSLFPWIGIMLFATILSADCPHFSRSLGAAVPAAVFVGCGLTESYEWLVDFFRKKRAVIFIGIIWIGLSAWDLSLYFIRYRGSRSLWHRTNAAWVDVAREAKVLAKEQVRIYLPEDMYNHPSVKYLSLNVSREKLLPMKFPEVLTGFLQGAKQDHVVLVTQHNHLYPLFQKEIPSGEVVRIFRSPEGTNWALFYRIHSNSLIPPSRAEEIVRIYKPETKR